MKTPRISRSTPNRKLLMRTKDKRSRMESAEGEINELARLEQRFDRFVCAVVPELLRACHKDMDEGLIKKRAVKKRYQQVSSDAVVFAEELLFESNVWMNENFERYVPLPQEETR